MKILLIIITFFVSINAQAQQTKKVTIKNDNPKFKEVYYVLKSAKTVKHGSYIKYNFKGEPFIRGLYKNGLKDSLWTNFGQYNLKQRSIGSYSKGKKIGVWEFYNFNGILEQEYNYTNNKIIYNNPDETENREYKIFTENEPKVTKLDRPPRYQGGRTMMYSTISKDIKFPNYAKANGISGKVYISFTISTTGEALGHKVSESVHELLDEEALRVVKLIPNNWIPGVLNGKDVNVEYKIPISFILK
tara:strand:- start:9244 stop:9981 length:738 start_codon:yes stop_codon:yes gene_type:complete